jgi:hypothetical protein
MRKLGPEVHRFRRRTLEQGVRVIPDIAWKESCCFAYLRCSKARQKLMDC